MNHALRVRGRESRGDTSENPSRFGQVDVSSLDPPSKRELARLLPELAEPGRGPTATDDYLRLFGAVSRAIEAVAAAAPLVLVVDDLHWADDMSVRLFGFVARRLATLDGATIAELSNHKFGAAYTFEVLERALKKRFPRLKLISHREFGNTYGNAESEVIAALPDKLKALEVDAVISGNAG